MRDSYRKQLETLHISLIRMGAFCEEAIANAVKGLLDEDMSITAEVERTEKEINLMEREIEAFCLRLLLREQPVAGDLRQITAAQRIITDMERIGDQAADIAELSTFMVGSPVKSDIRIGDMARAAVKMLTDSVDAFVGNDLEKARAVIAYDDVVDDLFDEVKNELISLIAKDGNSGGACLDLLMIAKYLERIGDHATNIAECVEFSVTGHRGTEDEL
ncbi:MAG: phosphate signaling complex protein PhoU [Clostridiales Family XIII bacterium]|jgi:phosphate transport system protein|nr:phosphate signaling complex protein PhoU [Clostridiales Family XIII bacterium]